MFEEEKGREHKHLPSLSNMIDHVDWRGQLFPDRRKDEKRNKKEERKKKKKNNLHSSHQIRSCFLTTHFNSKTRTIMVPSIRGSSTTKIILSTFNSNLSLRNGGERGKRAPHLLCESFFESGHSMR